MLSALVSAVANRENFVPLEEDEEQAPPSPALSTTAVVTEHRPLVERYASFCRTLQVRPHASVCTFMRLRQSELRPERLKQDSGRILYFTDADMFAFCDFVLLDKESTIFEHWQSVDVSNCSIGVPGTQMLMRVLQLPGCRVHAIDLANQNVGPRGAEALVETLRATGRISKMRLNGSFIHDSGGREFASG